MGSNLDSYHVNNISAPSCLSDDATSMSNVFNVTCVNQPGVNVPCDSNSQKVCPGADLPTPSTHPTRYVYHSHVDRRTIEGLLAKGNKAKALKLNNGPDRIRTRIFVSDPPVITCHTPLSFVWSE